MSDEKEKKKPLTYKFYCKICGAEMRVVKKHAQTCSDTCRMALSNIMRYGAEPDEPITKEQRAEIDEKIEEAKGLGPVKVLANITNQKGPKSKKVQEPISDKAVKDSKESQATPPVAGVEAKKES